MSFFVCLVRPSGDPITAEDRRPFTERLVSRGLAEGGDWEGTGSLCAWVTRHGEWGPCLARFHSLIGVGDVRIDNSDEILGRLDDAPPPASDLELALRATAHCGADLAADLLGDFAYVAWNSTTRRLLAARDAFGVKPLFQSQRGTDLLAFSSHASLLAIHGKISKEYIAKTFVRSLSEEASIYASVDVVPAAHILDVSEGRRSLRQYWSAERFETDESLSGPEAAEALRERFAEAVRHRLTGRGPVWSELSGGLDTSAVVSMASWLRQAGATDREVAGTVTYTDSLGSGDESEFVDAVVRATGVENEQVSETWPWQDDGGPPILTEKPGPTTMFWSRNRQRNRLLREDGAEVLLGGLGGDHLLGGNLHFFADRLAAGAIRRTLSDLTHWAASRRRSFWKFAFVHAALPLMPEAGRSRLSTRRSDLRIPEWVTPGVRERAGLDAHLRRYGAQRITQGPLPRYRSANVVGVDFLARSVPRPPPEVPYERRYPFLHRPLVELTLRLPPELKINPHVRKVALRRAMRGVLPEQVRLRRGKGGVSSRMVWALDHEHRLIESLLRDPVLAQMGCVDAANLRTAYDDTRNGKKGLTVPLYITLGLETWLSIELGRWPRIQGANHTTSTINQKETNNYARPQHAVPEADSHGPGLSR